MDWTWVAIGFVTGTTVQLAYWLGQRSAYKNSGWIIIRRGSKELDVDPKITGFCRNKDEADALVLEYSLIAPELGFFAKKLELMTPSR